MTVSNLKLSTGRRTGVPAAPGYRTEHQRDVINRLKRIEGQVRGLIDMVEEMSAARKAMDKAFYRMMATSVMEAVSSSESEVHTFREVERSTRILEKYA